MTLEGRKDDDLYLKGFTNFSSNHLLSYEKTSENSQILS